MAIGACAQARREAADLRDRVDSTSSLARALGTSQENFEKMKAMHQAAFERASLLSSQVRELQGFREQSIEARSELAQIRLKHADDVRSMQLHFEEKWNQLKDSYAEEKDSWNRRFDEEERRCQRQQDQLAAMSRKIIDRDDRLRWQHDQIAKLTDDLEQSRREIGDRQSQIDDLQEDFQQSKAAKLKAVEKVRELSEEVARWKGEAGKIESEAQERFKILRAELASSRHVNSELGDRLAEANDRLSRAVEEYKGSSQFSEDHRAACADAFRLGEEETKSKISEVHPEWDLSFLDVDPYDSRTPGAEEAEYEEISDVDLDAILGSEAPVECSQLAAEESEASARVILEVGEGGQAPSNVDEGATGADATPNP